MASTPPDYKVVMEGRIPQELIRRYYRMKAREFLRRWRAGEIDPKTGEVIEKAKGREQDAS